jgi:hypothetical protein
MPESGVNAETTRNAESWAGLSTWTNPVMPGWGQAGEAYLNACSEWQREIARFFGTRVNADICAQQSLAACRSWTDASKLQQDWVAATMKDYLDESGRLFDIVTRCAQGMCCAAEAAGSTNASAPAVMRVAS